MVLPIGNIMLLFRSRPAFINEDKVVSVYVYFQKTAEAWPVFKCLVKFGHIDLRRSGHTRHRVDTRHTSMTRREPSHIEQKSIKRSRRRLPPSLTSPLKVGYDYYSYLESRQAAEQTGWEAETKGEEQGSELFAISVEPCLIWSV